jgi:transcriptional regulator with GAF, ATPase, and Fis domain
VDVKSLQSVLLTSAEVLTVDDVLQKIVNGLGATDGVALARIWLIGPGDSCANCRMATDCDDRRRCLHLAASFGNAKDGTSDWSGLDGDFRRFPLGVRKIGRIGTSGEGLLIENTEDDRQWLARPQWARDEGIRSFAGHPMTFHGEMLGVLGVFSRAEIDQEMSDWLRAFADHAAVSLSNARAFQEIADLRGRLEEERDYLRAEVAASGRWGEIIGESPALQAVIRKIKLVAATDASVLILGESGTGKELVARGIHENSGRRDRPLVRVNCASIPKDLFESEFFGHVRGAFTGAHRDRIGRFELADAGTLLLDEVGEIPTDLQGKLLRVLQEGQFERVGDEHSRRVDVRVVAATNRNLAEEVAAGRFREDLYYRLSVFPIELPPLRERREDIGALAVHFLRLSSQQLKRAPPRLSKGQVRQLESQDWPGNIRELQNVIERAAILSTGDRLALERALPQVVETPVAKAPVSDDRPSVLTDAEMRRFERDNIMKALKHAAGKVNGAGGAAELLGLKPSTLTSRMKAMGISKTGR